MSKPRLALLLFWVGPLAGLMGCAHFGAVPEPDRLYSGPALPTEQVAILSGPVIKVDGVDVAHASSPFALLPGCHLVEGRASVSGDSQSGTWSAYLPRSQFALRMQAGRSYLIYVDRQGNGSEINALEMRGEEVDSSGKTLAVIKPMRSKADMVACQEWAARQPWPPQSPSAEPPSVSPQPAGQPSAPPPSAAPPSVPPQLGAGQPSPPPPSAAPPSVPQP